MMHLKSSSWSEYMQHRATMSFRISFNESSSLVRTNSLKSRTRFLLAPFIDAFIVESVFDISSAKRTASMSSRSRSDIYFIGIWFSILFFMSFRYFTDMTHSGSIFSRGNFNTSLFPIMFMGYRRLSLFCSTIQRLPFLWWRAW